MLNANEVKEHSKRLKIVHYQENDKKENKFEVYEQHIQKFKNINEPSETNPFVKLARSNSLKQIENIKRKANIAVLHKGYYFKYNNL